MADTIDFVAEDEIQPEEIDFQEEVAPVVRIVPPGSLNPDELLPAVRKIGGALAVGEPGDTHPDIIKRDKIPATDIDQRGFAGPQGEFYDRESAAQGTQLPTEMEPGRLHSTDLRSAQSPEIPTKKTTSEFGTMMAPGVSSAVPFPELVSEAAKGIGGLLATGLNLIRPTTWLPEEAKPKQFVIPLSPETEARGIGMETPQEQRSREAREMFAVGKPLYEIEPGSPAQENELNRLLSRWSTPEGVAQFSASAHPLGGFAVLIGMVPDLVGQIKDVVKGKGTDEEKRDRVNDLMAISLMTAHGKAREVSKAEVPPAVQPGEAPPTAPVEVTAKPVEVATPATVEPAITEAKPEITNPQSIASNLGLRYRGTMRGVDQYVFDEPSAKTGVPSGITVSVPSGTTESGVAAKLASRRAEYSEPSKAAEPEPSVVSELGLKFDGTQPGAAIKPPTEEQLSKMSPAEKKMYSDIAAQQGDQWAFTPQPGSAIPGRTFYVKAGASGEEIRAAYERKVAQEAETKAAAPVGLPEPKEGTVRVFSGGRGSSWYTTNIKRAGDFAKRNAGVLNWVDVPKGVFDAASVAAKEAGSFTEGDALLPNEWVKKSANLRETLLKQAKEKPTEPVREGEKPTTYQIESFKQDIIGPRGPTTVDSQGVRIADAGPIKGVDAGIAGLLEDLNAAGFTTAQSMSGLKVDYPSGHRYSPDGYIAWWEKDLTKDQIELIRKAAKKAGIYFDDTGLLFFQPSVDVRVGMLESGRHPHEFVDIASKEAIRRMISSGEISEKDLTWNPGYVTRKSYQYPSGKHFDRYLNLKEKIEKDLIKKEGGRISDEEIHNRWTKFRNALLGTMSPVRTKEPTGTMLVPEDAKLGKSPLVSMGHAVAGEKPAAAQIEQLTQAMRGVQESKAPLGQQIREAFNIGQRFATAKSAIGQAVSGLKTSGDLLINKWKGVEKIDDLLRAKGKLSQQIEARGWRLRQWERAAQKAIPSARDQAAIAKWVDAGGDRATLEKGLAESPAKFKQAYADALALKGDKLTAAQNVQNYFESRLQEAIDAGVLDHGVENYIHRMYESKPDLLKRALAYTQTGLLKTSPSLAKKRVFQFDWEAEKEGYVPVQSFIKRITAYEASLSKAIAAREFIKKASELKAPDGRPIIDIKGVGIPIEDPAGVYREATLIKPKYNPTKNNDPLLPTGAPNPNYRGDYANRDYRALSRWKWVGSDAGGKPIYVQGDVAIHPDYVGKIDVLLQPSQVRYGRYGKILRPALGASSVMKQTMLDLSGFHYVQITVHGMEHRVFPWNIIKDIDLSNPSVDGLLKGGVSLGGDYGGAFREGLVGSSLTRLIPGLGNSIESYHQWLFQDYIPRIKMTMALHALERNRARFGDRMSEEEIFRKTANQANAAFGELNYIMLERSKTAQDISRLILLAPDFLEARARFALQAFEKGGKRFGNEQRMALLFGALTMWITARIANKIVDGQYHNEPENLFNIVYDGHAYGLRTVQGDILHFLTKPIQFWTSRLNPVYGRTTLEALTGRDYFGRKRSFPEQAWDAVSTVIPISLRSNKERKLWESLLNGFGVTARRWSDVDDAFTLAKKWKETHGVTERGEFIYDPQKDVLRPLKLALNHGDEAGAAKEIKDLIDSKAYTIERLNSYFDRYANMPFAGSFDNDKKFKATLTDDQKKTVEAARQHKIEIKKLYQKSREQYLARPVQDVGTSEVKIDFVEETK